jgi:hypothetical protein
MIRGFFSIQGVFLLLSPACPQLREYGLLGYLSTAYDLVPAGELSYLIA